MLFIANPNKGLPDLPNPTRIAAYRNSTKKPYRPSDENQYWQLGLVLDQKLNWSLRFHKESNLKSWAILIDYIIIISVLMTNIRYAGCICEVRACCVAVFTRIQWEKEWACHPLRSQNKLKKTRFKFCFDTLNLRYKIFEWNESFGMNFSFGIKRSLPF